MNSTIAQIRLRADSTLNWNDVDPILAFGEAAVEITSNNSILFKIGDGIHKWSELNYQSGDLTSLANQIEANRENIESNTTAIEGLEQDIEALETAVSAISIPNYYSHFVTITDGSLIAHLTKISKSSNTIIELSQLTLPCQISGTITSGQQAGAILTSLTSTIEEETQIIQYHGYLNNEEVTGTLTVNSQIEDSVSEIN